MIGHRRADGLGYRADIDGLRAVAIVPVVLYHSNIAPFSGGFVGVDVFFVISGYLITSLIGAQIDRGKFSLRDFYLRRIRRIFPALFVMMTACAVIGLLLLAPQDLKLLGQSIFATVLFSSNILFWRQSGYFDAPPEEQPLLHTWSLAVEEQFYLAFPLFLILVSHFLPRRRMAITLILCIASFILNVLTVATHPTATFYLAPSRVWELSLGSLLAMGALAPPRSVKWREAAAAIGLALIGCAVFGFSKDTVFPGFAALLPTIGTAAVIWAGTGGTGTVTRLLSHRGPVFVGHISYSLYLWHFPLLAFGAYVAVPGLTIAERAVLITLSVALAIGSWVYIEQPVRQGRWIFGNARSVVGAAATVLVFFGCFGLAAYVSNGFPGRIGKESLRILASASDVAPDRGQCVTADPASITSRPPCKLGSSGDTPQFALWGDSHGESLIAAVDGAAEKSHQTGVFLGSYGCVPEHGIARLDVLECRPVNDAIIRYLVSVRSIHTVVLAGRWGLWAEGLRYKHETGKSVLLASASGVLMDNHAALAAGLERTIAELIAADKQVWLVGPIPEVGINVPRALYVESLGIFGAADISPALSEFNDRERFVLKLFAEIATKFPVRIVWPHKVLCGSLRCNAARDGRPLYFDDQHLTLSAARSVSDIFDPIFAEDQSLR